MADGEGEGTPPPSGEPVPEPAEPGAGIERTSVFSRRALGVLVAALFALAGTSRRSPTQQQVAGSNEGNNQRSAAVGQYGVP
jgi:hypothetical protein